MFELVAVLAMDTFPLVLPADVGLKSILKVTLWPTAKLIGRVTPVTVKPGPGGDLRNLNGCARSGVGKRE